MTPAQAAGVEKSAWTVAELVGHSDTRMISQHYNHLSERTNYLRQAAEQATKK